MRLIRTINLMVAISLATCLTQNRLVRAIKCYVYCDAYPRADLVPRNELDVIEEKGFFSAFSQPPPVKPLMATMCRKIRQKVDGEWRTIRGCGYLGPPGDVLPDKQESDMGHCQMRHGSYDVFMESCTCNNKDGCNAATSLARLGPSAVILLSSTVFTPLFLYL